MTEQIKQGKLPSSQHLITLDSEFNRINIYLKMRNIKMPLLVMRTTNDIKIDFTFDNTIIEFRITNINTSYKDAVQFIEAMCDEFNTPPIRQYKLGLMA